MSDQETETTNDVEVADAPEVTTETEPRPRVALMGEFSAGKSTLSNLLVGRSALPVNVTATQLPPVWMSYGDEQPYRVGLDGEELPDVAASYEFGAVALYQQSNG